MQCFKGEGIEFVTQHYLYVPRDDTNNMDNDILVLSHEEQCIGQAMGLKCKLIVAVNSPSLMDKHIA